MAIKRSILVFCVVPAVALSPLRKGLDRQLLPLTEKDTACVVWVVFRDKNGAPPSGAAVSPRAAERRRRCGITGPRPEDLPLSPAYIDEVKAMGGRLRRTCKWENAASFSVRSPQLLRLVALPQVHSVVAVQHVRKIPPGPLLRRSLAKAAADNTEYGYSFDQLRMVWVPQAHAYLRRTGRWPPGSGVLIGIFDSGFWLNHVCFDFVNGNGGVIAERDFVEGDSVVSEDYGGHIRNSAEEHGSWVAGILAGYDPQSYLGIAWGAQYVLAKTENDAVEDSVEEENWAEAIVWAESLGVEIVNSSLGYRYDFSDAPDYPYERMDGKSTIISRAAEKAAEFGVIVVNAMGNEELVHGSSTITAPADAEGVVSVGAVGADSSMFFRSSRGPTADGRTKPDLVALGRDAVVPDIYSAGNDGYIVNSGTSFATPIVAGICALIRHVHPDVSADGLKARLYSSCSFIPGQVSVDNTSGRGLPNALLSCLHGNELFFIVRNSTSDLPVEEVRFSGPDGTRLGSTDSSGILLLTGVSFPSFPVAIAVSHGAFLPDTVFVDSLPGAVSLSLDPSPFVAEVRVQVRNAADQRYLAGCAVTVFDKGDTVADAQDQDGDGSETFLLSGSAEYLFRASMKGYESRDTLVRIDEGVQVVSIALVAIDVSRFLLYPSVVRPGSFLTVEFAGRPDPAPPRSDWQRVTAAVRGMDGAVVWTGRAEGTEFKAVTFAWDCTSPGGRRVAPGVYYFILEYAGETAVRKFMVAP
jgi:serine protease AprX